MKKIKKMTRGKKIPNLLFFFLMKNSDSALLRNKRNAVFLWLLGVHIRVKETNTDLPLLTGEPTTLLGGTHLHVPSHSLTILHQYPINYHSTKYTYQCLKPSPSPLHFSSTASTTTSSGLLTFILSSFQCQGPSKFQVLFFVFLFNY